MPTELDASPETSESGSQSQDSPPPDGDRPDVSGGNGGNPSSTGNDAAPESGDIGSQTQDSRPPDRPDAGVGNLGHSSSPGNDASPETRNSASQTPDSPPPDGDRPDVTAAGGDHPNTDGDHFEPFDPKGPKLSDYEGPHFGHTGSPLPTQRNDLPTGDHAKEAPRSGRGSGSGGLASATADTAYRREGRAGPGKQGR